MDPTVALSFLLIILIVFGLCTSRISSNVFVRFFIIIIICVAGLYCIVYIVLLFNPKIPEVPEDNPTLQSFDTENFPFAVCILKKHDSQTNDLISQLESLGITDISTWDSEREIWNYLLNTEKWTFVLEGDVILHDDFIDLYAQYWKQIKSDVDIIHIGHTSSHKYHKSKFVIYESSKDRYAYCISKEGVKKLLKREKMVSCILNGNHCFSGVKPDDFIDKYDFNRKYRGLAYKY